MNPVGLVLIAGGAFALCGAGFNWDWFMDHPKARFFSGIFGRTGARLFYGLLGVGLVVLGGLFVIGVIRDTR